MNQLYLILVGIIIGFLIPCAWIAVTIKNDKKAQELIKKYFDEELGG